MALFMDNIHSFYSIKGKTEATENESSKYIQIRLCPFSRQQISPATIQNLEVEAIFRGVLIEV